MAVPFFHSRREGARGADQWLPCAYAHFDVLRQDAGRFPLQCPGGRGSAPFVCIAFGGAWREDAFRRMPPEIFCMVGGHTGAQSSSFCVRMAFSQGFGKGQADSRCNAPRGQPLGCPRLYWRSAAYPGEAQKKPYPVSFGIRHFEKGVNERGNQPCQPICASTNRHT